MLAIERSAQYKRHRPENTLLYQLIERYYPEFTANLAEQGKYLPKYVEREFDEHLRCGRLEQGFMRVVSGDCKHEKLVAFSCKRRGFCPSCGARRMAESAALLVDDVLHGYPIRQWVLSLPIPLRLLLAAWNEADSAKVRIHLENALGVNIRFVDSSIDVSGIDGFEENVHEVKLKIPRAVYSRTSGVDSQHGFHRYHWAIHQDGKLLIDGFDVTQIDEQGKVACVIGFFGKIPES